MSVDLSVTRARRVSVGLIGIALAATGVFVGAPAQAASLPAAPVRSLLAETGDAECLTPEARSTKSRGADTAPVSDAVRAEIESALQGRSDVSGSDPSTSTARLAAGTDTAALPVYRVKVQIHIIHGRHRGERKVKRPGARRLFTIMQAGFNGAQWQGVSEPMGVIFDLKRITISRNDDWYHARYMTRVDKQMRRKLHRGTAQTLNLYIKTFPKSRLGTLLGHARFPWQYRQNKKFDGVEINVDALPGGRARGYNLGDTAIHETGHWLGLLHTFQGGCSSPNDYVADTPAEGFPARSCSDSGNLCDPTDLLPAPAGPGYYNPALNFMEYTLDSCMRMFTAGQHAFFERMYRTYRLGR